MGKGEHTHTHAKMQLADLLTHMQTCDWLASAEAAHTHARLRVGQNALAPRGSASRQVPEGHECTGHKRKWLKLVGKAGVNHFQPISTNFNHFQKSGMHMHVHAGAPLHRTPSGRWPGGMPRGGEGSARHLRTAECSPPPTQTHTHTSIHLATHDA